MPGSSEATPFGRTRCSLTRSRTTMIVALSMLLLLVTVGQLISIPLLSAGSSSNGKSTKPMTSVPEAEDPLENVDVELSQPTPNRYRDPFPPMMQSTRPCLGGLHTRGRWVFNSSLRPSFSTTSGVLGCCQKAWEEKHAADDMMVNGTVPPRPETQYQWVPDQCDLVPWSEENFCRSLRGRSIMIVGDSLNDHWHASLVYRLKGGAVEDMYLREGTERTKHRCYGHTVCQKYYSRNEAPRILFLTNQYLTDNRKRGRFFKWKEMINEYPILVLNSGAWMLEAARDSGRFITDASWQRHMRAALQLVRGQQYNGTIVWRTTYSGHPECWKYDAPLEEELTEADFPTHPPYGRYRWHVIPARNNFTSTLWRNAGAHILDVARPTNLMPLGHLGKSHPKNKEKNTTDCLHYCSPGVYDTWSELFMNLLLGNIDG